MSTGEGCKVWKCYEPHFKDDYCAKHRAAWIRAGRPLHWQPKKPLTAEDLARRARNAAYLQREAAKETDRLLECERRKERDRIREERRAQKKLARAQSDQEAQAVTGSDESSS